MPFNISRESQFYDKEVLKYPQMNLLARSIVVDANAITLNTNRDQRTVVPAGTAMTFSVTLATRYVPYSGTGRIEGILTRPLDILASATGGSEPAAIFFHEAVFVTEAIVGFTQYASAYASSLPTCRFE